MTWPPSTGIVAEVTVALPRAAPAHHPLWRGSDKDKTDAFTDALGDLADMMTVVTCSIHKQPVAGAAIFHRMVQEVPGTVVIAYIGRSNGAGPTSVGHVDGARDHCAGQHQGVSR